MQIYYLLLKCLVYYGITINNYYFIFFNIPIYVFIFDSHFNHDNMITREQVFEKLKAKYEKNSSVSERSVNEALEKLMLFVTDDTEEAKFLEIAESIIETMAGQIRNEVSTQFKAAMEQKKKEAQEKPVEKPVEEPVEKPADKAAGDNDNPPAWAQAFMQELNALKQKQQEDERIKSSENARKRAIENSKLFPENVIQIAEDGFDFSQEGAEDKFVEKVSRVAAKIGFAPRKGEAEGAPQFNELKAELENLDAQLDNF